MNSGTLESLQTILGYQFNTPSLLLQALAHRSVFTSNASYERLEFLGDRVLGLILARHLFLEFKTDDQGKLTKRFHAQAQQSRLYEIALKIELQKYIIAEKGTDLTTQPSILADVVESVIAALYLDGGLEEAERFIIRYWDWQGDVPEDILHNPKSALQEWSEAHGLGLPSYELVEKKGPDHLAEFTTKVKIEGYHPATGSGSSKKLSEQDAAKQLMVFLTKQSS
ncbi:ribonuclease III [Alphaproteobacteria bacterium]|jgi:ribonuclease III|nr:ribonuclease III [Alphaproteobacteria bacterium]MBT5798296.1 ribonuclease III [Alphaproteobacteria bacterium]MDA9190152.1 ribonuclease III [Alphaproteobacteria bacterium]MDA9815524.1 ribonuclease III [Alphaproteobacteria bacterium]MDC0394769.1 ribonuclease III [Alphaproteobacteria bacterium]